MAATGGQQPTAICGQTGICAQPEATNLKRVTDGELARQKGRPPPGGEEARVVVYQPRGVGLIHPRLKAEYCLLYT
ncbi:hypothetical protein BST20_09555 [Mycobacterium branderi]|uniref:Uncharacterized protein n=1 Tax=Mycobacterium branderi TaxID=43348 RepID=A0AA91LYQ8_9MYCO|nr:hypothetical protein BST20_09555 [Mycobacterium branderi]